jgi:hypothetical protein
MRTRPSARRDGRARRRPVGPIQVRLIKTANAHDKTANAHDKAANAHDSTSVDKPGMLLARTWPAAFFFEFRC